MKRKDISDAVSNISTGFIQEAADYTPAKKRGKAISWKTAVLAAVMAALLVTPIAAYTVETVRFNAAVEYLRSKGIDVTDKSDYSRQDIIREAERFQIMEVPADPDSFSPSPADPSTAVPALPTEPADVTSEQIRQLTPTMTSREVTALLGDTVDIGSGIYILAYRVDGAYLLRIPFASFDVQLGVTGAELLLMLEPIE